MKTPARVPLLQRLLEPARLGLPLLALALLCALVAAVAPLSFDQTFVDDPEVKELLLKEGAGVIFTSLSGLLWGLAGALLAAAALARVRKTIVLHLLRVAYMGGYAGLGAMAWAGVSVVELIRVKHVAVDGTVPTIPTLVWWYVEIVFPVLVVLAVAAALHLRAWGRDAMVCYGGAAGGPTWSDRFRTKVRERILHRQVRGIGLSVVFHVSLLFLPLLLQLTETVTPYLVPYGKGSPDAGGGAKASAQGNKSATKATKAGRKSVQVKLAGPARQLKGVIFSPDAGKAGPDIREAANDLSMDIDTATSQTYVAGGTGTGTGTGGGRGPGNKAGGLGKGGIGPGGWPDGMKGAIVRFVRLEHRGEGWDDGMEYGRADMNFLEAFNNITGFPIANKGEHHSFRALKLYPKGKAPPFVYLTGERGIVGVNAADIEVLRAYLLDGGMLFADCGSAEFDRSFKQLMTQVFADKNLLDIPDDDPIYQEPYSFPNGAPMMWHHGGTRALGVKLQGRWCVFYHPGDLNDAWKTGNSNVTAEKADAALHMGVNIVYYAFTHYLEATQKYRK